MPSDNFDLFDSWFKDFHKRNGGYHPTRLKGWFERVQVSHSRLRKFIGGKLLEKTLVLKAHQNPASAESVTEEVRQIKELLPGYLDSYQYTDDVFLKPTIDSGTHNVVKTAKHIRQYAERALDQYYEENRAKLARLDKALSSLGSIWARARVSDCELTVTLSTTAKGFALLGHYGPDHDSCFRQGSDKTDHKYIFGQTNDTFVLTVSKFDPTKKKHKNVVRCIGFTDAKMTTFNLANCYFLPGFQEGDFLEALKLFFEDLWKDTATLVENIVYIPKEIVFHNPYGNWSFLKGKDKTLTKQVLSPNVNNIRLFVCPKCATEGNSDHGWEDVDDEAMCRRCASAAFTCAISNKKTFKELVPLINDDSETVMVCQEVAAQFKKCEECGTSAKTLSDTAEALSVCNSCLELNFTQCDCCEEFTSDVDMFDSEDGDICNDCVNQGNNPYNDETMDLYSEFFEKLEVANG